MVKDGVLHIVFIALATIIFGQDEFIQLKIEPKTVAVGQPFTVTIKTNVNGQMDIHLPDEFVRSGPMQSGMSSSIQVIKGKSKVLRYSFQSFSGYIDRKGNYRFGPVKVENQQGETFTSKSHEVTIIAPQNMISENPVDNLDQLAFGIVEQSKSVIYEGEPIIVSGKVYSQARILDIANYKPIKFSGPSTSHPLSTSNRIQLEVKILNGKRVQSFDIGETIIFPGKVGTYTLLPFKTTIVYNNPRSFFSKRYDIVSNSSTVTVKPLPNGVPENFIGGVGKFTISSSVKDTHIQQGDVVELHLKVKGHGNLQHIKQPELNLPKYLTLYGDPEVADSFSYCQLGAEGSKTFTYFIQVNKSGTIEIDTIEISYFNPKTERYEYSKSSVPLINVEPNETSTSQPFLAKETEDKKVLNPYVTEDKWNGGNLSLFSGWQGAALLFSPVLIGLFAGGVIRKRTKKAALLYEEKEKKQQKNAAVNTINQLSVQPLSETSLTDLTTAFHLYLSNHFNVNKSQVSREFLKYKIPSELSRENFEQIVSALDKLDAMRYGMSIENTNWKELTRQIQHITKTIG